MAGVFAECHRVLKDAGILVFTYHHSRKEGWSSVAHAVSSVGFRFVFAQPVKAEMSVARPKHQAKEPIDLDIILVCRKLRKDERPRRGADAAYDASIRRAQDQITRFWQDGRRLSRNDVRIVVLSQFLVALSAGRSEDELLAAFDECGAQVQDEVERLYANARKAA